MSDDPRDWDLEYDGAAPPLPREMKRDDPEWSKEIQRLVPKGAYFVWFEPRVAWGGDIKPTRLLAGVVRIHHETREGNLYSSGSGDLYFTSLDEVRKICADLHSTDSPSERLKRLQMPPAAYRYYLRLETLWVVYRGKAEGKRAQKRVILGFDSRRFDVETEGWMKSQPITFQIAVDGKELRRRRSKPESYRGHEVINSYGNEIGKVRLVRVAKLLRHATVEVVAIHRSKEEKLKKPVDSVRWRKALKAAGWAVDVVDGDDKYEARISEYTTGRVRELLNELAQVKAPAAMDAMEGMESWKYWLLIVEKISGGRDSSPLGIMPDYGDGSEDPARQGGAVAARQKVPFNGKEKEHQEHTDLYYRTAMHELGHMQGLYHNPSARGIMQPRKYLAGSEFDAKIDLKHSAIDSQRLRHFPDRWVRPGGFPFLYRYQAVGVEVLDLVPETEGLTLEIETPRLIAGHEVQGEFLVTLINKTGKEIICPNDDRVKAEMGYWRVVVRTPSGQEKERGPFFYYPHRVGDDFSRPLSHEKSSTYHLHAGNFIPRLFEVGPHILQIQLIWSYSYPASTSRGNMTYRVDREVTLIVYNQDPLREESHEPMSR